MLVGMLTYNEYGTLAPIKVRSCSIATRNTLQTRRKILTR